MLRSLNAVTDLKLYILVLESLNVEPNGWNSLSHGFPNLKPVQDSGFAGIVQAKDQNAHFLAAEQR
jgi:hypothetical protein